MSKLKSHRASRKRMKVTKNGKILRSKAGKSHIMSHMSGKRSRQLRKNTTVDSTILKTYRKMLEV